MARIQEQVIIVKLSKLVKDKEGESNSFVDAEFFENAESLLQQLAGDSLTVEVLSEL